MLGPKNLSMLTYYICVHSSCRLRCVAGEHLLDTPGWNDLAGASSEDLNAEELNSEELIEEEVEDEDEDETKVIKFEIEGKTYLKSEDNVLYDMESHDAIGIWNDETKKIEEIPDEDED